MQPIPYTMVSSWGSLAWILDQAVTGGRASPENIPKMIIFIDDVNDILDAIVRGTDLYPP